MKPLFLNNILSKCFVNLLIFNLIIHTFPSALFGDTVIDSFTNLLMQLQISPPILIEYAESWLAANC